MNDDILEKEIGDNDSQSQMIVEQKEYIKISKNTKGYNFEFKILSLDVEELDEIHNKILNKIKEWENVKNE
jgi:hypothetical protein